MAIVRWEPFRDLVTAQDRFNRLFEGPFARIFGEEGITSGAWVPPVDIYEADGNLVLKAELPGVNPDDVEVRIENNTLYLKGERKCEKEVKEENFHRVERSYGSFSRTFTLPQTIDTDKVQAEYKNGVLTLTAPRCEEAKPKTIKIDVSKA